MAARALSILAVGLFVTGAVASADGAHGRTGATVAYVVDGDTIALSGGSRVRLLQIDAPEMRGGECYSRAATRELRRLLPAGTRVRLVADPRLDRVDRYGRLLRYAVRGSLNVNVALARRGAVTVWFYGGVRGRHAGALLRSAARARREGRGIWGACNTVWNPYGPAQARRKPSQAPGRGRCDPSYPTVCIPSPPPDLDCADVGYRDFTVRPPDPHRFDGDRDGRGCERH